MDKKPKDNLAIIRIVLIVPVVLVVVGLIVVIVIAGSIKNKKKPTGPTNVIEFESFDSKMVLEEQQAWHDKMYNNIENVQSNINEQKLSNEIIRKKLEEVENRPIEKIIYKEKHHEEKRDNDTLNIPHSH